MTMIVFLRRMEILVFSISLWWRDFGIPQCD